MLRMSSWIIAFSVAFIAALLGGVMNVICNRLQWNSLTAKRAVVAFVVIAVLIGVASLIQSHMSGSPQKAEGAPSPPRAAPVDPTTSVPATQPAQRQLTDWAHDMNSLCAKHNSVITHDYVPINSLAKSGTNEQRMTAMKTLQTDVKPFIHEVNAITLPTNADDKAKAQSWISDFNQLSTLLNLTVREMQDNLNAGRSSVLAGQVGASIKDFGSESDIVKSVATELGFSCV